MKRYFALTLDYLFLLVAGILLGTFFLVLSYDSTLLIAGRTIAFSKDIIAHAYIQVVPEILFFIPCGMMLYKIRHLSNPTGSAIAFLILCLLTWFGIFPLHNFLSSKISGNIVPLQEIQKQVTLSDSYFRKINGSTYYYLENHAQAIPKVVEIDSADPSENTPLITTLDVSEQTFPYKDPLVKQNMEGSNVNYGNVIVSVIGQGFNAWKNGFIAWLCFCSLGLALCGIYSFIRFSDWRLVNAFMCIGLTVVIIWFNHFYFTPEMTTFRNFVRDLFYDKGAFSSLTKREVEVPLMFINLIFGVLTTASGFIISAIRNKRG